jgi:hypothetical protein
MNQESKVWIFDTTAMEFASRIPAAIGYPRHTMIEMGWCASKTDAIDKAISSLYRNINHELDEIKRHYDSISKRKEKIDKIKQMKGSI